VSPLEDTAVIQAVPESSATEEDTVCMEQQCKYMEVLDHNYVTKTLGYLLENTVCYIAGKILFLFQLNLSDNIYTIQ